MVRFLFALLASAALVLIFLSIFFFKDAYKVLPVGGSDPKLVSATSDWYLFKSPKGSFQAYFPKMPQSASQVVKDPKTDVTRKYEMYVSEKDDGTIFMISVIEFLNNTESMEILKKTVINDLLISNPQNQLKSMQVGNHKLFKTIDFVIENPASTIHGMTFSDGNVIYLLSVIFNSVKYDPTEYSYFINSFEWMAPQ